MAIDIITATKVVGPAMTRTFLATLRRKRSNDGKPTDDPGYKETLELMRSLLNFCSFATVEDLHQITGLHTPAPPCCNVVDVEIPKSFYGQSANFIQAQLGTNLDRVGSTWWQWRKLGSVVVAQWVEMKSDYLARKEKKDVGNKVMFYVHGGAYFLGGIGHDIQIQRHARKLQGRVFAPRYRLAPQFPFPCAVQDVLSAYLYLLTIVDSTNIVIAGDSAGGGLCLALLILCRDQNLPMPAGASLISPWVDLTHSFPSITIPSEFDYIPVQGFHAKPSLAWPPPSAEEMEELGMPINPALRDDFVVDMDGLPYKLKDQIQMYAPNHHLQIPLVSGITAASLGGFCPTQIISGGGELLRDEQMYLAHKMADPERYAPCEEVLSANGETFKDVMRYPPTNVQLLVFNDGPHAAPTLGHSNVAKHQYRAIAQFSAWALSRAQRTDIEIEAWRNPSVDSANSVKSGPEDIPDSGLYVGRAGDRIQSFVDHMIRLRVDRDGRLYPLEPASQLRCCNIPNTEIGVPKGDLLKGWLKFNEKIHKKFGEEKKKVHKQRRVNASKGYITFPNGEVPPPSALAGMRVIGSPDCVEKAAGKVSLLGKMFGRFNQQEPVVESAQTMEDFQGNAKRRSTLVRFNSTEGFQPGAYR